MIDVLAAAAPRIPSIPWRFIHDHSSPDPGLRRPQLPPHRLPCRRAAADRPRQGGGLLQRAQAGAGAGCFLRLRAGVAHRADLRRRRRYSGHLVRTRALRQGAWQRGLVQRHLVSTGGGAGGAHRHQPDRRCFLRCHASAGHRRHPSAAGAGGSGDLLPGQRHPGAAGWPAGTLRAQDHGPAFQRLGAGSGAGHPGAAIPGTRHSGGDPRHRHRDGR